jgi:carbon-monoxide dehydrogenase small subunit
MSEHDITLTVDGTTERLTVDARTLLVDALRDAGYTAPKVGCESGTCGACTVHLDGEALKSCSMLAVQADGRRVTTATGLADDGLHRIQEHLHAEHGVQCGYCTPGLVMTVADVLDGDDGDGDVRAALKGNVCRCTGYQNVVTAVEGLLAEGDGGAEGDAD